MRLGTLSSAAAMALSCWICLCLAVGLAIADEVGGESPPAVSWKTEELDQATSPSLKKLEKLLSSGDAPEVAPLAVMVAPGFTCDHLIPEKLEVVYGRGAVEVLRSKQAGGTNPAKFSGASGLREALTEWRGRMEVGDASQSRAKLKQFKITPPQAGVFSTRIYVELSRVGEGGSAQANAVWSCQWESGDAGGSPKLVAIQVEDYEETRYAGGGHLFEDVTVSALGANPCFEEQIVPGIDHWLPRITKLHRFWKFGWHGVAVGDVNGDGLDDLYFSEAGGLPNRLFLQNPDGTATDASESAGVDWLESTSAALLIDLDNDGDQDLVAATKPMTLFLENDGRGKFEFRSGMYTVADPFSLSAADYDLDGDLDLYVCGYNREDSERNVVAPVPYHDANNGGRSALLRNDGGFKFVDASAAAGLDSNHNTRFSLACAWEDYDNDGDPDLYVANDYGRNNLYRNDGPGEGGETRFTDVAGELGVEDISSGMSITWGDYDRDGRMDAYVSNMFSAAGNRVTYQRQFAASRAGGDLAQIQRMARGNSLFRNRASGFLDVSEDSGTIMGRWAWASLFGDLNNDGWEDLMVTNGFITSSDSDDL